jgi:acetyl esterase/lipase
MGRFPGVLLVLLGCSTLAFGQEVASEGSTPILDEQFKRLDQDGDGRLSKAEAGDRPFFGRADADGDGVVTREEARAALAQVRRLRPRAGQVVQSRPGTAVPKSVDKSADIRYSEADGGRTKLLTLDIYRPREAKDLPMMIYVHGGGWTRGDKQAVGEKMPYFCQQGYVFVSVNYRMLPETKVPDQAQDVAAAVAWVHNHAREFGGNPDRLFLMGHSAGAHLVSVVATNEVLLGNCGKDLSVIKGLIELDTAALDVMRTVASGQGMHARIFGADPETLKIISPYEHVTAGKSIPPFMLVVADNNTGKLEQSNSMAKKLREAGVRAEVVEAPDKTHGTLNQDLGKAGDKVTEKVMAFLEPLNKGEER